MIEIMENQNPLQRFFSASKRKKIKEYLTAYLFIAPSTILIFIFGIFPVGFALFVSLHKWRIKRTAMIGLDNYVDAIGNLAYVAVFFLGIGALIGIYFLIKKIIGLVKQYDDHPWLCILPGILNAAIAFSFLNWFFKLLPEVLDIADKLLLF